MKRYLKIPLYIAGLFLLGMLSGHLTFKLLSFSRTVEVPDLKGKSMLEANSAARSKGLYVRPEGEEFDALVPQGHVVRQDIPPNSTVKEGREVRIVLSRGPRFHIVPDVVGKSLPEADAHLRERGIRIGKIIYVHSRSAARDTIVAQRPEPNESGGDQLVILVSRGDYEEQ